MKVEGLKEKIAQNRQNLRAAEKAWRKLQKLCPHKSYQAEYHKRCPDCYKWIVNGPYL